MEVQPTAESTPYTKLVSEHLKIDPNVPRLFSELELESDESCDFKDPFFLDDFARLPVTSDVIKNCRQPVSEYFDHDDQRPEPMFEGDV